MLLCLITKLYYIIRVKEIANKDVTDEQMANTHFRFPIQTPQNKEEYYYRTILKVNSLVMQRHYL